MEISSRYSLYKDDTRNEEIVLLQGTGCFWKGCRFCDYYLDTDDLDQIIDLNSQVLENITGETGHLTVLNSGSYFELPEKTQIEIEKLLANKNISDLSIEAHLYYKDELRKFRDYLKQKGIALHPRIGIETFDEDFRENILNKNFGKIDLTEITEIYDECCLLYGIKGQSKENLLNDLKIALDNFKTVYLNIYEERKILPADPEIIKEFINEIYPKIKDIKSLKILINNTDLGVG